MFKWIKAQWAQLQRAREILRAIDRLQKFMKANPVKPFNKALDASHRIWRATNGLALVQHRVYDVDTIEFKSHSWVLLEYKHYPIMGAKEIEYEKHFSHKDVQDFIDYYKK